MSVQGFVSLQKAGSRSQEWIEMEDYYNRKLWHQLTLALLKYVKTGPHNPGHLSELHKTFVSDFDHRVWEFMSGFICVLMVFQSCLNLTFA